MGHDYRLLGGRMMPAWLYPVGTIRGNYEVVRERVKAWGDPTLGHGGGNWEMVLGPKIWKKVK